MIVIRAGTTLAAQRVRVVAVTAIRLFAFCSQSLRVFTLMTLEFGLVPLPLYARNR